MGVAGLGVVVQLLDREALLLHLEEVLEQDRLPEGRVGVDGLGLDLGHVGAEEVQDALHRYQAVGVLFRRKTPLSILRSENVSSILKGYRLMEIYNTG